MIATQMQATVLSTACSTSVNTTLNIPPLTTYSVVTATISSPHRFTFVLLSAERCHGRKIAANLPMPMNA